MKSIMWLAAFWAVLAVGVERYPVDDEIEILRNKADYLEELKNVLLENRCAITVDKNRVILGAGAIRSEALIVGITSRNPGNYNAFHQAPKPQFLYNVMNAGDAKVVVATLLYRENETTAAAFQVKVAEPFKVKGAENLWIYNQTLLRTEVPKQGEALSAEATTQSGARVEVVCNP